MTSSYMGSYYDSTYGYAGSRIGAHMGMLIFAVILIIAAMIAHPQLLVLDEPFNFLDPSSQNLLKKIILDYHKQTNATILVSSHNLQHTIEISTRVILLEKGKIIKDLPNENQKAEADLEAYFNREMSNE